MNRLIRMARPAAAAASILAAGLVVAGCAFLSPNYPDGPQRGPKYLDARAHSDLATTGIESSDIHTACNSAVAKLLSDPRLANANEPPRYSVDGYDFVADINSEFDTKALADLVRDALVNAGGDRVYVVYTDIPEEVPVDYVIGARITEVSQQAGKQEENYTQIAFQVVDPLSKQVVFSDLYSVKKAAKANTSLY
jgi:hypothetical protein